MKSCEEQEYTIGYKLSLSMCSKLSLTIDIYTSVVCSFTQKRVLKRYNNRRYD